MNLFVAKLDPGTTTKDLHKLFAHYGLVTTVKVIFDHFTGLSKCYGFVEMPNSHEALEALKELDNTPFQKSTILVKESVSSDYKFSTLESGYKNEASNSSGNSNQQVYHRNSTMLIKLKKDNKSPRNYGYHGSGYHDFM
jgi:RNA recognition motif-containing protein